MHLGAGVGRAGDLQGGADEPGTLAHAPHPATLAAAVGHAAPIVADAQREAVGAQLQRDAHAGGVGMTDGVGQRLLGDAVDDEFALRRLRREVRGDPAGDSQARLLAHSAG